MSSDDGWKIYWKLIVEKYGRVLVIVLTLPLETDLAGFSG